MQRTLIAASLIAVATANAANAAVLVNDAFNYANGNLNGKTPTVGATWTNHSGTANQVQVSGGKITLIQSTNSEDLNSGFQGGVAASASNPTFFAGFDLTVPTPTGSVTDVNFAHFLNSPSTFAGRLWLTAPTSTGYKVAASNGGSIGTGAAKSADLAFGTTYRVVESYDFTSKVTTLYLNPTASSTGTAAGDTGGTSVGITSYAFREAAGNTSQIIDNLLVGNTLAEVLGNTAPVVTDPAPVAVVFGSVVSNGAPFSATVSATDVNASDVLGITIGTLPAGISGISVSGGGTSPTTFNVSGTVAYSLNGQTVQIPYTVNDGAGGTATGNITLVITPEPTTLAALAGVATLVLRRRK